MNVATKICIFALLVASYDLLLGYTGTVSFAHTMFYGIGSYGIAIALYAMGPTWAGVATGIVIGLPLAALLALCIGLFSLRVQAIFFAMITLAVASAFQVLASQLSWLTGGDDGRSFRLPELLRPGTVIIPKEVFGFEFNGRTLTYYIVFVVAAALILTLLRIVNSPVRPRAAGGARKSLPRRGARLSHGVSPDMGQRDCRPRRRLRWRPQCPVAALCRAGDTLLHHHDRHSADGGDRRHGHDVRGDHRRGRFSFSPKITFRA